MRTFAKARDESTRRGPKRVVVRKMRDTRSLEHVYESRASFQRNSFSETMRVARERRRRRRGPSSRNLTFVFGVTPKRAFRARRWSVRRVHASVTRLDNKSSTIRRDERVRLCAATSRDSARRGRRWKRFMGTVDGNSFGRLRRPRLRQLLSISLNDAECARLGS